MKINLETLRLPVTELSRRIRARALSPVALTDGYLERASRLGPKLNAFVRLTPERARAEAKQAEREIAAGKWRGPLHGVPYAAKDLLAARGTPTTWGARPLARQQFPDDATVIAKLTEAGAILLGKAAMIELAGSFGYKTGAASLTGAARNPWRTSAWTCGSSSGSGAIVAASMAAFAIGSETWGSILCPSAHCGVTGMRPTYGRVSRHGAMALAYSLDKLGPMARTVDDCTLVLSVIAGHDAQDPASAPPDQALFSVESQPRKLKLGWVAAQGKGAPEANRAAFEAARKQLESWSSVEEVTLPEGPWSEATWVVLLAEGAAALRPRIVDGRVRALDDPLSRIGGYLATEIAADDYLQAQKIRTLLAEKMTSVWQKVDVLAGPSRGDTAYGASQDLEGAPDLPDPLGAIGNFLGLPSVSVPCGFVDGLPVGLQLLGPPFDEHAALSAARAYQQATDWHKRHPPDPN